MLDSKKIIESKINDIDQMISELDIDENNDVYAQKQDTLVDIEGLDVIDVLHNLLN